MKLVIVTCPVEKGEEIAKEIVNSKLAACVNIFPQITSIYWWEGKVTKDSETMLFIKTTTNRVDSLITKIKNIHPYQVPEIIVMNIENGNKDYLDWIKEVVEE